MSDAKIFNGKIQIKSYFIANCSNATSNPVEKYVHWYLIIIEALSNALYAGSTINFIREDLPLNRNE